MQTKLNSIHSTTATAPVCTSTTKSNKCSKLVRCSGSDHTVHGGNNKKIVKPKSDRIRLKDQLDQLEKTIAEVVEAGTKSYYKDAQSEGDESTKSSVRKRKRSNSNKTIVNGTINSVTRTSNKKTKSIQRDSSVTTLKQTSSTKATKMANTSNNTNNKKIVKTKSRPNKNSGFITCTVCGRTKYYSHVQRRYGIFSCEPCFKFFSRFIKEPRKFICSNHDKCVIVIDNDKTNCTGSRCKACWLKLCLDRFRINAETKQSLIVEYYPQSNNSLETETPKLMTTSIDDEKLLIEMPNSIQAQKESKDDSEPELELETIQPEINVNQSSSPKPSFVEDETKDEDKKPKTLMTDRANDFRLESCELFNGNNEEHMLPDFENSFFPNSSTTTSYSMMMNQTQSTLANVVNQNGTTITKMTKCDDIIPSNHNGDSNSNNSNRSSVLTTSSDTSETQLSYHESTNVDRRSNDYRMDPFTSTMFGVNCSDYRLFKSTENHSNTNNNNNNKLMNGKKSRCKECEGCRSQDCGQCTYCLDKKKFGGQNVIKQACKFRICIRFKNGQKINPIGSPSPNPSSSSMPSNPSPMSPPAVITTVTKSKPSATTTQCGTSTAIIHSTNNGKLSSSSSISSPPSFYPTPPPHSSSQHNSPISGVNTPITANYHNHSPMSHLIHSLPTPTTSPLSQSLTPNHYHQVPPPSLPPPPPQPAPPSTAINSTSNITNTFDPNCHYSNHSHYGNPYLYEPSNHHQTGNPNHHHHHNQSFPTTLTNYNSYESSNYSNHNSFTNYYPSVGNLNLNYKLNDPNSTMATSTTVNKGTNHHQSINHHYGQQFNSHHPHSHQSQYANDQYGANSYKPNNCLYFGDYPNSGGQLHSTMGKSLNHSSNYTTSIATHNTQHYQDTSRQIQPSGTGYYHGHQPHHHPNPPTHSQHHSNSQQLSCHGNYYDGYY
ncbi:hypothetical protein BLOT_001881 [Blomia tropicalis]|nr:hypothetical protein BLOT_001881 [Blomia tropicalis]